MTILLFSVLFVELASLTLDLGLRLMFYQLQVSSMTPVNSSIHSDLSDYSASQLLSRGNDRLIDQVYYPSMKEFGGNWCTSVSCRTIPFATFTIPFATSYFFLMFCCINILLLRIENPMFFKTTELELVFGRLMSSDFLIGISNRLWWQYQRYQSWD